MCVCVCRNLCVSVGIGGSAFVRPPSLRACVTFVLLANNTGCPGMYLRSCQSPTMLGSSCVFSHAPLNRASTSNVVGSNYFGLALLRPFTCLYDLNTSLLSDYYRNYPEFLS